MVDYVPIEKGMTIRQPSTANLMLDSTDRILATYPTAGDFQITKKASILNGFFTRIATTEVVLEWIKPNIKSELNNWIYITIGVTQKKITIPEGFYDVQTALDAIVEEANSAFPGYTFTIVGDGGETALSCKVTAGGATQSFTFETSTNLLLQLGFKPYVAGIVHLVGETGAPDLRLYRYLDFISNQLTYAQDLKDSSTSATVRDVLCRWYFAWDTFTALDGYGFPILQGYSAFVQRRIFNPPKQIRWEPNLPLGNLAFQVYGKFVGSVVEEDFVNDPGFEWLMTLQVSEV